MCLVWFGLPSAVRTIRKLRGGPFSRSSKQECISRATQLYLRGGRRAGQQWVHLIFPLRSCVRQLRPAIAVMFSWRFEWLTILDERDLLGQADGAKGGGITLNEVLP